MSLHVENISANYISEDLNKLVDFIKKRKSVNIYTSTGTNIF